jgi:hypothetical protein
MSPGLKYYELLVSVFRLLPLVVSIGFRFEDYHVWWIKGIWKKTEIPDFKASYTDIGMEQLFVVRCGPEKVIGQFYFLVPKSAWKNEPEDQEGFVVASKNEVWTTCLEWPRKTRCVWIKSVQNMEEMRLIPARDDIQALIIT